MIGFAILLYIFPPLWMLVRKGWPVRAGLAMLLASMLPMAAMVASGEGLSPGGGMVVLVCAPFVLIALIVTGAGAVSTMVRVIGGNEPKPMEDTE